jgi:hypothetical protein
MVELRPAGYCGTPSFLKIIMDKAANRRGFAIPDKSLGQWRGVSSLHCATG